VAENIKALGSAAGLSPSEQKRIDEFYKSLTVHKELSNLPEDAARAKYSKLTAAEQADLTKNFGNEDPQSSHNVVSLAQLGTTQVVQLPVLLAQRSQRHWLDFKKFQISLHV